MGQNVRTNQDVGRHIPVLENTPNTVAYWAEPISPAVEPTQQTPSVQLNSVRPIPILDGMKRVNPDNNESTVPTKKVRFQITMKYIILTIYQQNCSRTFWCKNKMYVTTNAPFPFGLNTLSTKHRKTNFPFLEWKRINACYLPRLVHTEYKCVIFKPEWSITLTIYQQNCFYMFS